MRITENKLRSIIRQVIKESMPGERPPYIPGARSNAAHFDPENKGWAPDDRSFADTDVEKDQLLQMLKDGMTLEEMGFDSIEDFARHLGIDVEIAEALCDGYGCA